MPRCWQTRREPLKKSSNQQMKTSRRYPFTFVAQQTFGHAVHARRSAPAAVAYFCRYAVGAGAAFLW